MDEENKTNEINMSRIFSTPSQWQSNSVYRSVGIAPLSGRRSPSPTANDSGLRPFSGLRFSSQDDNFIAEFSVEPSSRAETRRKPIAISDNLDRRSRSNSNSSVGSSRDSGRFSKDTDSNRDSGRFPKDTGSNRSSGRLSKETGSNRSSGRFSKDTGSNRDSGRFPKETGSNRSSGRSNTGSRRSSGRSRSSSDAKEEEKPARGSGRTRKRSSGRKNKSRSSSRSKKESSFNIYDKRVHQSLQDAFDAVLGMPFRGSLAFVGLHDSKGYVIGETDLNPRFCGPSQVRITLPKMRINVESAAYDDGNYAVIQMNKEELAANDSGINITVIEVASGHVESDCFNTHGVNGVEEVERMEHFCEDFVFGVEQLVVVALAVKDESSKNLKRRGLEVLLKLGVEVPHYDDVDRLRPLVESQDLVPEKTPSLLHLCAKSDAAKCVELLARHGWRLDYHAKHGLHNTALHDAIFHDSKAAAVALLSNGAKIVIKNKRGETADDMSMSQWGIPILDLIKDEREQSQFAESLLRVLDL